MPTQGLPHSLIRIMDKDAPRCPICGGTVVFPVYRFSDFSVLKCHECDSSWRSNMYTATEIAKIYCNEEYEENPYFSYDVREFKKLASSRHENYERALGLVESTIGIGKLLDVGCGSGAFLSLAKQRGWDVSGVEMSPGLSRVCQLNTQVAIANAPFEEVVLPSNFYDAITMWDIIEHVVDPVFCIQKVRALLKPGGIALFCTPNEDSLLARLGDLVYRISGGQLAYPAYALHPSYHTYFFSREGFGGILQRCNMRLVSCYSQEAFFEHSHLANQLVKWAIWTIEKMGAVRDLRYEIVVLAQKTN